MVLWSEKTSSFWGDKAEHMPMACDVSRDEQVLAACRELSQLVGSCGYILPEKCTSEDLARREVLAPAVRERVLVLWQQEQAELGRMTAARERQENIAVIGGAFLTVVVISVLLIWFQREQNQQKVARLTTWMSAPANFIPALTAVALLAAVLPFWPYEFYMALRLLACGAGAWCAWQAWQEGRQGLAFALGAVALLFNPFVPAHLTRELWSVLNIAAAGLFGYAAYAARPAP